MSSFKKMYLGKMLSFEKMYLEKMLNSLNLRMATSAWSFLGKETGQFPMFGWIFGKIFLVNDDSRVFQFY